MNISIKTLAVTASHHDGALEYDMHNLYGMYECKSTASALRAIRQKRHFILTRRAALNPKALKSPKKKQWQATTTARWSATCTACTACTSASPPHPRCVRPARSATSSSPGAHRPGR